MSRSYMHQFKADEKNANFSAEWDNAIEEGVDRLEAEAHRRAFVGVNEPVIYQGKMSTVTDNAGTERPLTVKKYSDQLTVVLLKAHRKEKYSERQELTGKDGGPIEHKHSLGDILNELDGTTKGLPGDKGATGGPKVAAEQPLSREDGEG